ncbi:MAG TPA: MmcQ/YjbR family DNA-binding protein [Ignavibacteria bacterium]|mgnify:CR=1 FL=1|nr:MmcQ/YjbR family DNA-binding protein [Ignavibacteria bacterium]
MNLEHFKEYCLNKKSVTEEFPFGPETLVYKVGGKIFAITSFSIPLKVNLKCDPEQAMDLRERFEEVQPGFHMNKKHWNTVDFEGRIGDKDLKKMIDHSYELVFKSLPRKLKDGLNKQR